MDMNISIKKTKRRTGGVCATDDELLVPQYVAVDNDVESSTRPTTAILGLRTSSRAINHAQVAKAVGVLRRHTFTTDSDKWLRLTTTIVAPHSISPALTI